MVLLALASWSLVAGRWARASSNEATLEPSGLGLRLLGAREAILLDQTERARQIARARGLALYRLLLAAEGAEVGAAGAPAWTAAAPASSVDGDGLPPRSVMLLTAVLGRDLTEARLLRAELDRVRAERARLALRPLSTDRASGAVPAPAAGRAPRFQPPVAGPLVVPFGVAKDPGTGAWSFRAAASYASRCGEPVLCPADGRVVRIAESAAGGVAVVLAHVQDGAATRRTTDVTAPWTTVISHLDAVDVTRGALVRRGERLGAAPCEGEPTVRVETWRGRTPVDPASVLLGR